MWLDADDVIEDEDIRKLVALKKKMDGSVDVFLLNYHVGFDEFGNITFTNKRERILRREANFQWTEPVHEVIVQSGNVVHVDIAIVHGEKVRTHSNRNLEIYEAQKDELSPRGTYYYARELHTHLRHQDSITQFEKFLDGGEGWVEDNISSCYALRDLYTTIGDTKKGLSYLFKTFLYDIPRAQTCCKIGEYFLESSDYKKALYWYDAALDPQTHSKEGFFQVDYTSYYPLIQKCLILSRLGRHKESYEYHRKSQLVKPDTSAVKFNENYFNTSHPEIVAKYNENN
jgi:tetratricopeptide (TPR) repeat protein